MANTKLLYNYDSLIHHKIYQSVAQTFLSVRFEAVFEDNTGKNARATETSFQAIGEILSCTKITIVKREGEYTENIVIFALQSAQNRHESLIKEPLV